MTACNTGCVTGVAVGAVAVFLAVAACVYHFTRAQQRQPSSLVDASPATAAAPALVLDAGSRQSDASTSTTVAVPIGTGVPRDCCDAKLPHSGRAGDPLHHDTLPLPSSPTGNTRAPTLASSRPGTFLHDVAALAETTSDEKRRSSSPRFVRKYYQNTRNDDGSASSTPATHSASMSPLSARVHPHDVAATAGHNRARSPRSFALSPGARSLDSVHSLPPSHTQRSVSPRRAWSPRADSGVPTPRDRVDEIATSGSWSYDGRMQSPERSCLTRTRSDLTRPVILALDDGCVLPGDGTAAAATH